MNPIVQEHICSSLDEALHAELPFKIPVTDYTLVENTNRSNNFLHARSGISHAVDGWLLHQLSGDSEMAVTTLDGLWILFIENCCAAEIYRDQAHSSSIAKCRPDATICKNHAVVLKHEAKALATDLAEAENELTEKLFPEALLQFPFGSQEIVGVTTSASIVKMYRVFHHHLTKDFQAEILQTYSMNSIDGRISFIIDVAKLCRWIAGINRPNKKFHLILNVRTLTPNQHHITWCKDGLLKEFKIHSRKRRQGGNLSSQMMTYMQLIHSLHLNNVEWGRPVEGNDAAVMITRVGRRIQDAILDGTAKRDIYDGVVEGLKQLHEAGFAHCDISVNNVFVDVHGVFLDDLEYLTPTTDLPPHQTRIPAGTRAETALELDNLQLQTFALELDRL
jgi:hypothetical protein